MNDALYGIFAILFCNLVCDAVIALVLCLFIPDINKSLLKISKYVKRYYNEN